MPVAEQGETCPGKIVTTVRMPRAEPGNQPSKVEFHHVSQGGTGGLGVLYGLRETHEDASKLTARRVPGPTPNTLGRHVLTAMPTNRPFRTLEC